jgi:hypothetical protein
LKRSRSDADWKLAGCLAFSVVLHAAFLVFSSFGGSFPKVDVRRHARISATISIPSPSAKRDGLARINNEYRIPAKRQQGLAESADGQDFQKESAQPSSSLVIDPEDLDKSIVSLAEPELEPEYGFSDDAIGRVVLNLLISDTGSVVWVGVASADLDAVSTRYIVKAFASAKFSTPVVGGRPVYTMIQVEVRVGQQ